jgi:hypothetical protein
MNTVIFRSLINTLYIALRSIILVERYQELNGISTGVQTFSSSLDLYMIRARIQLAEDTLLDIETEVKLTEFPGFHGTRLSPRFPLNRPC